MPLYTLAILASALLAALDIIAEQEAQKPTPPQLPYTPPFTGGQCLKPYHIEIEVSHSDGNTYYVPWSGENGNMRASTTPLSEMFTTDSPVQGKINSISIVYSNSQTGITQLRIDTSWGYAIKQFMHHPMVGYTILSASISRVRATDNQPDSCGDIPNPNPYQDTIPSGGYGVPPANPSGVNYEPSILYAPIIPAGGALAAAVAALATANAAIAAATTVAVLAAAIADFFDAQKQLDEEKEKEKKKEKEKEKKKEVWRQRLGMIRSDGILSLIPRDTNESIKLLYLEINFVNIPDSIGKYFGEYSPNRYPYGYGLGYIGFYGAGAGIREVRNMEFRRNSIPIPADTMGFIYHLGLNTSTSANVDLIYEREVSA